MSLIDSTQQLLEAAMHGSMQRQTLLTDNLANADTPGYQNEDLNFQSTLQAAVQSGKPLDQVTFTPSQQGGATSADGNGVSAEQDSANLAENGLLYQQLTEVAAGREQILLTSMGLRM